MRAPPLGAVDFHFFASGERWQAVGCKKGIDAGNATREGEAEDAVLTAPLGDVAFKVNGMPIALDENGGFVDCLQCGAF